MAQNEVQISVEQLLFMAENEKNRFSQMEAQYNALRGMLNDTQSAAASIDEIRAVKGKKKVFVSFGGGIFAEALIENTDGFLFTLPGGVVINRGFEETKKSLEERVGAIKKDLENLQKDIQLSADNMNSLNQLLAQVAKAQRAAQK